MTMSAIEQIASFWYEGAMRTLDAMRTGWGVAMDEVEGATPSSLVYEGGLARLKYYEARGTAHRTPILLVYSLIKRPFILDLQKGRSVVELLTGAGFDVYLLDWIPPRRIDKNHGFNEYVNVDLANVVRAVQIHSGIEKISVLGYCFGAVLTAMYAALHPQSVANLLTVAMPLDSTTRELPTEFLGNLMTKSAAEAVVASYGNVPAAMMNAYFTQLAPAHHMIDKFVGAYRRSERDGYLDTFRLFEKWLHSDVPMAGKIFLEMIDMTAGNLLVAGGMKLGRRTVDLKNISCPLLNIVGDNDDIVNPKSSAVLKSLVGSLDATNLHFPTGHMGAATSADALKRLWPQVIEWLATRDGQD